jgi:predicted MFS family arabinose efflux permease
MADNGDAAGGGGDARAPSYRGLIVLPQWRCWTCAAGASWLPVAMAPLALVFLGQAATGSFATGSIMASAFTFSEALAAPACGRIISRRPDLRTGIVMSLAAAALLLLILGIGGQADVPAAGLITLSAAAGAMPAGVQGSLRAMLARLVPGQLQETAYAADSALLEVEWAAAPALVALCSLAGSPPAALIAMAAAALVALALVRTLAPLPAAASAPPAASGGRQAAAWRAPAALGAYLASLILGYAEGTVNLALPPLLQHIGSSAGDAGFLLAGLSAASAAGGFGYGWLSGKLPPAGPVRGGILLIGLGLLVLPIAAASSLAATTAAVAGFGLLVAPVNAIRSFQLAQALPTENHPEGFSALYAANGIGYGIAGLASAALLHDAGPRAALITAGLVTVAIAACAAVAAAVRSRHGS